MWGAHHRPGGGGGVQRGGGVRNDSDCKAHIPLRTALAAGRVCVADAKKRNPTQMKSTQKVKCTCPLQKAQHLLYSTDWRQGLASGVTQILDLASGVIQILVLGNSQIYQHVGISNTKFWCRGHCPTPTPDARYFESQWNIGLIGHIPPESASVVGKTPKYPTKDNKS